MKRGFSLIEMLIYLSILGAIFTLFTNSLLAISRSYAVLKKLTALDSGAIASMERITREIREATSVDLTQSTLGSNPGVLVLNQVDSFGSTSKLKFSLTNQVLHIARDSTDQGVLLPSSITAPLLIFYSLDSGISKAVKIEMQLRDSEGGATRNQSYYSTVILRGSYK